MKDAYDPELFRRQAHAIVDKLADHLAQAGARSMPVLPWKEPRANVEAWANDFQGGDDPLAIFARAIEGANHLQHPGFVGHQVTAPIPLTGIAELIGGILNNGMAVYEMGPVSSSMERVLARWMTKTIGWAAGDAIFTSGGSAGNLTALLAARERHDTKNGAVLTCEETHYSTARAVRIMGFGTEGLFTVPSDERFKMKVAGLEDAYRAAKDAGKTPFAVVASACSTSTGAFDPLHPIADFCEKHGLWLHVDGAHGASFLLSKHRQALLDGIERADSIVWDAHKMMLCPALVTAVCFKDAKDSFAAFQGTKAAYLLDEEGSHFDSGLRTLECTKRMLVLGLYVTLATHGEGALGKYLDDMIAMSKGFAAKLAASGFEVAVSPECNIVCFRRGTDDEMERVRREVIEEGRFYIVKTRLRGKTWLRTTILNPRTTTDDLDALVQRCMVLLDVGNAAGEAAR